MKKVVPKGDEIPTLFAFLLPLLVFTMIGLSLYNAPVEGIKLRYPTILLGGIFILTYGMYIFGLISKTVFQDINKYGIILFGLYVIIGVVMMGFHFSLVW